MSEGRYEEFEAINEAAMVRDLAHIVEDVFVTNEKIGAAQLTEAEKFVDFLKKDHTDVYEKGIKAMDIRNELKGKLGSETFNKLNTRTALTQAETRIPSTGDESSHPTWNQALDAVRTNNEFPDIDAETWEKMKTWRAAAEDYVDSVEQIEGNPLTNFFGSEQ